MSQFLIPGYGFYCESGTRQFIVAGHGFVLDEYVAAAASAVNVVYNII